MPDGNPLILGRQNTSSGEARITRSGPEDVWTLVVTRNNGWGLVASSGNRPGVWGGSQSHNGVYGSSKWSLWEL